MNLGTTPPRHAHPRGVLTVDLESVNPDRMLIERHPR